jgi:SH3 domain
MGRITGSASIETLVRVGIEKEIGLSPDSKMVVLHNFVPCVDDELEVKRGQIVNILYRENDWVYVIGQDSPRSEGFIPHSYCAPYNTAVADMAIKKKLPREVSLDQTELAPDGLTTAEVVDENSIGPLQGSLKNSQASLTTSEPDFFSKDPSGRFIVLYTFIARDENDVSVERGEFVTVLNREDPEWYWVVRSDGSEGFIPSGFVFVYPGENILQANKNGTTNGSTTQPLNQHNGGNLSTTNNTNSLTFQQQQQPGADDLRYHGTELVMLYDYKVSLLQCFHRFVQFKVFYCRPKLPTICQCDAVTGSTPI